MSRVAQAAVLVLALGVVASCSSDTGGAATTVAILPTSTTSLLGTWTAAPSNLRARSAHGVAVLDGAIYAAGGTDEDGRPLLEVERFDGVEWEIVTELPGKGVNAPSAAAVGGLLYVIGGFGTSTGRPVADVHVYDPASGAWSTAQPLPTASGGHAAAVLDGRIHVIGGGTARSTVDQHVAYDPATDSWTSLAPLPRSEGSPAAVVLRGQLWAIGGRSGRSDFGDVYIYDQADNVWTLGPQIGPRGTAGAVTFCDTIFVVGGESQSEKTVLADVLRLDGERWVEQAPMPSPRSFARAVEFDGGIYVVGGSAEYGRSHASPGSAAVEHFQPVCD